MLLVIMVTISGTIAFGQATAACAHPACWLSAACAARPAAACASEEEARLPRVAQPFPAHQSPTLRKHMAEKLRITEKLPNVFLAASIF